MLSKLEEMQRLEAYKRQQAALPFNQRELPFTDEDVARLGDSEFEQDTDERDIIFLDMEPNYKMSTTLNEDRPDI